MKYRTRIGDLPDQVYVVENLDPDHLEHIVSRTDHLLSSLDNPPSVYVYFDGGCRPQAINYGKDGFDTRAAIIRHFSAYKRAEKLRELCKGDDSHVLISKSSFSDLSAKLEEVWRLECNAEPVGSLIELLEKVVDEAIENKSVKKSQSSLG